jgi:hypothetical protein
LINGGFLSSVRKVIVLKLNQNIEQYVSKQQQQQQQQKMSDK